MELLFFVLPLLIVIGILSSWYDLRKGIIPNQLIFPLFAITFLVYLIFFIFGSADINFILITITNFSCAVITAYFMWKIKWWYGGDAKLFALYALLIPISVYQNGYIPYFPSLILLMNTFVPITLFFIFPLLTRTRKIHLKPLLLAMLNVFALSWLPLLFGITNITLTFFIILAIAKILEKISFNLWLLGILSVGRLFLDISIAQQQFFINFLFWTLLLVTIKQFISQNAAIFVHKSQAKTGIILAEEVTVSRKHLHIDSVLTQKQAAAINKQIWAYDTMPFAIYMFLGVLITLISKGIFLAFVTRFI